MSKSWEHGSTRHWRERVRAPVLLRDGFRCRAHADGWCAMVPGEHECAGDGSPGTGRTRDGRPMTAHHTLGRAVTGDDIRHLVASCAVCNGFIGQPQRHNPQPKRVSRWS